MKNVVIGVIIILLLVVVGVWYFAEEEGELVDPIDLEQLEIDDEQEIDDEPEEEPEEPEEVVEVEVISNNYEFSETEIRVTEGDIVRLTLVNEEGTHDWVIDEFGASTNILEAGEEETIEFLADEPGEFEYYCAVGNHRAMGMVGTLIVEPRE